MTTSAGHPAAEPAQILARVCAALDALIAAGEPYGGLFPSILDRRNGVMAQSLPPGIPGQRTGDRSHHGPNLLHDEAALATLDGLAAALDRPDYAAAANRYLRRWATHSTDTETGLFPWGEHAYWHLLEDR